MKVILASASERRQELLGRIIDSFDIMVSNFDESTVVFDGSIDNYVKEISIGKALEVKERLDSDQNKICNTRTIWRKILIGEGRYS